jgi:hypothetical protein
MQSEVAVALSALGNTAIELREPVESAEQYLRTALETIDKLPESAREDERVFQAHSDALIGLGILARQREQSRQAQQYFAEATDVRRAWTERFPNDAEAKRKLANAMMNEALVLQKEDKLFDAELMQIEAQQIRLDLVKAGRTSVKLERDMANAEFNLAMLELRLDNLPQVAQRLQKARQMYGRLVEGARLDSQLWVQYADARLREAHFYANYPRDPEADRLRASRMINEALSDLNALFKLYAGQPEQQLSLLDLYEYGLAALLSQNNIELLAEHSKLLAMMLDTLEQSTEDPSNTKLANGLQKVRLQSAKYQALVAVATNADNAISLMEAATDLFDEHADLVAADPLLAEDAQKLNAILTHLLGGK